MSFSYQGERGNYGTKSTASSTQMTVSEAIAAGDLVIVVLVTDNDATSDGESSDHTSVLDSQANLYTKIYEYTESSGSPADGVTVSLWFSELTTGLGTSDTITGDHTSCDARAIGACEFSTAGSVTLEDKSGATGSGTSVSTSISGLTQRDYLMLHVTGIENKTNVTVSADADYTNVGASPIGSGTAGAGDSNVAAQLEYRIANLTGDTVTGTISASSDWATALGALYEDSGGDANVPAGVQAVTATVKDPGLSISSAVAPPAQTVTASVKPPTISISSNIAPAVLAIAATLLGHAWALAKPVAPESVTASVQVSALKVDSSVAVGVQTLTASLQSSETVVAVPGALGGLTTTVLEYLTLDLVSTINASGDLTPTVSVLNPAVDTGGADADVPAELQAATASVLAPVPAVSRAAGAQGLTASVLAPSVRIDDSFAAAAQTVTVSELAPVPAGSKTAGVQSVTASVLPPSIMVALTPVVQTITAAQQGVTTVVAVAADVLPLTPSLQASALSVSSNIAPAAQTITASVLDPNVQTTGDKDVPAPLLTLTASVKEPAPAVAIEGARVTSTASVQAPETVVAVPAPQGSLTASVQASALSVSPNIAVSVLDVTASAPGVVPSVAVAGACCPVTTTVLSPAIRVDAAVAVAPLGLTVNLLDPTVDTTGNIEVQPAVLGLTASLKPSAVALDIRVAAPVLDVTASIPKAHPGVAINDGGEPFAFWLPLTTTVLSPQGFQIDSAVAPAVLTLTTSVETVTVLADKFTAPAVLDITTSVLPPNVSTNVAKPSPALSTWSGVAPTTTKTETPTPAAATWTGVVPSTTKAFSVSPASVTWTGVTPGTGGLFAFPSPATATWTGNSPGVIQIPVRVPRSAGYAPYELEDHGDGARIVSDRWYIHIPLTIDSGSETNTLRAPGSAGQRISLIAVSVSGGTRAITADSAIDASGNTTMTFNAVDDRIVLEAFPVGSGLYEWRINQNEGPVALS